MGPFMTPGGDSCGQQISDRLVHRKQYQDAERYLRRRDSKRARLLFEIVVPILGVDRIGVRSSTFGKRTISATTIRNRLSDISPSLSDLGLAYPISGEPARES